MAKIKKQEEVLSKSTLPPVEERVGEMDIEEIDELNGDAGRFKFENVLKSMIARIELCGGLAPI